MPLNSHHPPTATHLTSLKTKGVDHGWWIMKLMEDDAFDMFDFYWFLRLARFHPLATQKGIIDIDKIW